MTSLPITLPLGYVPVVAVGDSVTAKQVIAEKKIDSGIVTIIIAEELDCKPQDAGKTIKKNPHDILEPGDIIASKKGFLGMGEQKVVSSVAGKILSYDRRTSELSIQVGDTEESDVTTIFSPVDGIVRVCDNEKIVVETEKDALVAAVGFGGHAKGEILVIKTDKDEPVPLHALTSHAVDKIVIARFMHRDGLLKAIGMGCLGIIVHNIDEFDVTYFAEKGTDVPLLAVGKDEYDILSKLTNKQLFIDGEKKSIIVLHT